MTAPARSNTPGTAVAKREPMDQFRSRLAKFEPQLAKVLPSYLTPERMTTLALTAATKTPQLLDCTPESIALAMMQIAQWGLEPNRTAHLVPFGKTCTAIADWKGLVQLMLESRHVKDVKAVPVYANEHFILEEGLHPVLEHRRIWGEAERGELTGFYAVAYLTRGGATFEAMTKGEVEAIRNRAASRNSDAWRNHFVEMGKKTVIRRLAKRMPQTPQLQGALAAEAKLAEIAQTFGIDPDAITSSGDAVRALEAATHPARVERDKQLMPAADPSDPYRVNGDAVEQSPRNVPSETVPRVTEAQRATASAAAEMPDPFAEFDELGPFDEAPIGDAPEPLACELYEIPAGIGPRSGRRLGGLSTADLDSLYRWAAKPNALQRFPDLAKNCEELLDARRNGDAAEPTA